MHIKCAHNIHSVHHIKLFYLSTYLWAILLMLPSSVLPCAMLLNVISNLAEPGKAGLQVLQQSQGWPNLLISREILRGKHTQDYASSYCRQVHYRLYCKFSIKKILYSDHVQYFQTHQYIVDSLLSCISRSFDKTMQICNVFKNFVVISYFYFDNKLTHLTFILIICNITLNLLYVGVHQFKIYGRFFLFSLFFYNFLQQCFKFMVIIFMYFVPVFQMSL